MANSRINKKPEVATQRELSQQHIKDNSIDMGGAPSMPFLDLQPDNTPHINRGNETSKNNASSKDIYLGLETIDEAIFYYFNNVIKPVVEKNGLYINVPVIYGAGERWKMAQRDGYYRDKNGKVQTPLIMLKRQSIEKRRDLGNKLDANNPELYVTYQEKYTSRNQYDSFALLTNKIPQKEFTATVVPDYINLTYTGIIWTDYISQLNKIIEAVNYASDAYWGDNSRFKFMAQINQFSNITEVKPEDNRISKAEFSLNLQGYIIPENLQKKLKETNTKWYSKSELVVNSTIEGVGVPLEDTPQVLGRLRPTGSNTPVPEKDLTVSGLITNPSSSPGTSNLNILNGITNPNKPYINRAIQVSKNDASSKDLYLGLENIDEAIFYYFDNIIKPNVLSNGDLINVPVVYGSGERWKMVQKDGYYRDKGQKIQSPLIMLRRQNIEKRRDLGNKLDANDPKLYVTYQEKYTPKNQYDTFNLLNNRVPQKEFTATVVPDYINLTYEGFIWTDYISQLNKIIEAVNYASDAYWGNEDSFRFIAQIDSFDTLPEITTDDNRLSRARFTLKLQGYIIPENLQKKLKETNTRWFSKSQFILNQQTTVIDDTRPGVSPITEPTNIFGTGGTVNVPNNNINIDIDFDGEFGDTDWLIYEDYIQSNRDVRIFGDLLVNQSDTSTGPVARLNRNGVSNQSDLIVVSKENIPQIRINSDGVLILSKKNTPPLLEEGGLAYIGSDLYIGLPD